MWKGHPRTTTPTHRKNRAYVLKRDNGICHICGTPGATEADHVIPLAEGGADDVTNMAPIHPHPCHAHKSALEGNRARWHRNPRRRPTEQHPGLKGGG